MLLGTAALLWIAAGIYARSYLKGQPNRGRFAVWWLLSLTGSLGVFMAGDMATFYVPPHVGEKVMPDVARKKIPEVWLNPGSESDALIRLARSLNVEPILACSIMGIGENPYV